MVSQVCDPRMRPKEASGVQFTGGDEDDTLQDLYLSVEEEHDLRAYRLT